MVDALVMPPCTWVVIAVLIAMAALVALNSVVTARGPQNEAPVETADAGPA